MQRCSVLLPAFCVLVSNLTFGAATHKHLGKPMPETRPSPSRVHGPTTTQTHADAKASHSQVNLDKQIPFKCTSCGHIERVTIRDLQKKVQPDKDHGPMMGPMTLDCPKCQKKTLAQAVECPKCATIFVMKMDPKTDLFDDRCPKCQESYAKAWQERYRKSNGE